MSMSELSTLERDAELVDRVRELMATTFVVDAVELPADVSQQNWARWTSLYHMMLMVVLEEQFEMTFTVDEMTSMTSLAQIVGILKRHGITA